jgi:hypothetical protein
MDNTETLDIQQMASPEQIELWNQIEADLRRAYKTLPSTSFNDSALREFEHFLDHNELELACDSLEVYAEDHQVSQAFWLALRDASVKMQLDDRTARYDGLAAGGY